MRFIKKARWELVYVALTLMALAAAVGAPTGPGGGGG